MYVKIFYKLHKEILRFYAKITDFFFLSNNFFKYQLKYSKIYQNNYNIKKKKYIIIHPPKTGGTSITVTLGKSKLVNNLGAHTLISKKNINYSKYIFLIRDPIKRVFSYYNMSLHDSKLTFYNHAKAGIEIFSKIKINQNTLCRFLTGEINNDIDEDLYKQAIKNLKNMNFIFDFENFQNSYLKLKKKFKINKKINYNIGLKKNLKKMSKEDFNIIKRNNYYDLKLYNYYLKKIKKI